MSLDFNRYIEKKKKEDKEYNDYAKSCVEAIDEILKLLEENKHYKIANQRLFKKLPKWVNVVEGSIFKNLTVFSRKNNKSVDFTIYNTVSSESRTPENLLKVLREFRNRFSTKEEKSFQEDLEIFEKIKKLAEGNSLVCDVIKYGLYNR